MKKLMTMNFYPFNYKKIDNLSIARQLNTNFQHNFIVTRVLNKLKAQIPFIIQCNQISLK